VETLPDDGSDCVGWRCPLLLWQSPPRFSCAGESARGAERASYGGLLPGVGEEPVVAPVVRGKEADAAIRVWVPGCATGEEAYSIAMNISPDLPEFTPGNPGSTGPTLEILCKKHHAA
jgi:CheR methyltransferase, SAM binding domain